MRFHESLHGPHLVEGDSSGQPRFGSTSDLYILQNGCRCLPCGPQVAVSTASLSYHNPEGRGGRDRYCPTLKIEKVSFHIREQSPNLHVSYEAKAQGC